VDHRDLVVPVLDHVERAALEQDPVAVRHGAAAEVDLVRPSVAGVDEEQLAEAGLDRDQTVMARGGDAVQLERGVVHVVLQVTGEWQRARVRGQPSVTLDLEYVQPLVDPAKKSFPNPVAIPSGCHPFGSGIVSGYGCAEATGAAIAHGAKVAVRMRSDAGKFPPRTRCSPRGDTQARRLWVRTVRDR
jgi:hypothetical protein